MDGFLEKSTTYFSRWKKRYFIIRDNVLYYYREKGGELRGRIHLSVATVKNYEENDRKFELDSGLTSINLRAETKEERDIWINKIKSTQYEHEAYEREYLKRNQQIFGKNNEVYDEIINLQSKLEVIKKYIEILENYNTQAIDLVKQKNCKEELSAILKENIVNSL